VPNTKRLVAITALVIACMPALVEADDEAPNLKGIMQGLRDSLVQITDGLLMGDFARVADGARAVAEHPKIPPADIQRVAAELGPEMAAFKRLDTFVHDLSLEIHAAAKAQDSDAAIAAYQRMLEGCFACHRAYKNRVAAVLSQSSKP
jgi:cytochrome c556